MECIEAIGDWILVATEIFLSDNYLKYVGWMLSDKDALVRRRCLNVIFEIYGHNVLLERMQTFQMRFKDRLMEMTLDVDSQVRILALRVLSQLSLHSSLDSKDFDVIADLVVDEDAEVRKMASIITSRSRNHLTTSLTSPTSIDSSELVILKSSILVFFSNSFRYLVARN